MVVTCPGCLNVVFPKANDTCPSCGASTKGAAEPPPVSESDRWDREDLARDKEKLTGDSGSTMIFFGLLLMAGGVLFSLWSYWSAREGGSYWVWSGGIVAGFLMLVRGAMKPRS